VLWSQYKRLVASGHYPEVRSVFVRPHEVEALLARLEEQGTDSPEQLTQKLTRAADDMEFCKVQQQLGTFDRIIVNGALEVAVGELKQAVVQWCVARIVQNYYQVDHLFRNVLVAFRFPHVERHSVHHSSQAEENK
jgi:guanylate kinase